MPVERYLHLAAQMSGKAMYEKLGQSFAVSVKEG